MESRRYLTRYKGVMCVKSSNKKGDYLLVSCGNEDDPLVKIWHLKDQITVGKYFTNQTSMQHKNPYYYLNVVFMNDTNEKDGENIFDETEDRVKKGFVIFAASIKSIDVFLKNPGDSETYAITEQTQDDIGSYLSSMAIIKHDEDKLTLLVGNVNGVVEQFRFQFESNEDSKNTSELDSQAFSENSAKTPNDSKEQRENRIRITNQVDIRALIERHRKEGRFTDESEDSAPMEIVLKPPAEALSPEKDEDKVNQKRMSTIGKDAEGKDLSGISLQMNEEKDDSLEEKI